MTFTFTSEEISNQNRRAEKMRKRVKRQIAEALLQERLSRRLKLEELSVAVKIAAQRIENMEFGRKKINWVYVAMLLKYYGKRFQVSLVDSPIAEDEVNQ